MSLGLLLFLSKNGSISSLQQLHNLDEIKQDSQFLKSFEFQLWKKYKNNIDECNLLPGVIELKKRLANTFTEIICVS